MSGFWVVLEAPSLDQRSVINEQPASLITARRVLYSLAARLETTPAISDVQVDYLLSDTGALCEALRWRVVECDGSHDCSMVAYLTDDPDPELLSGGEGDGPMPG
jgi:hypothetical protein